MTKCKFVFYVLAFLMAICLVMLMFYGIDFAMKEIGYDSNMAGAPVILGTTIAVVTLCKGLYEYQGHQKRQRIQYLIDFGKKYTENKDIVEVVEFLEELEDNNTEGQAPDIHKVEMYMRFFEELQLLIEKKAINKKDTHYLFGHYTTILKKEWESYWPDLGYNETYWKAFRAFADEAEKIKNKK